ncbi:NAD(P)/FAD-dependent oxidoreductase [Shimia aestuarii]|uniref:Thioredoxin reductase n=1 Tax=Shimia aestuarii TaxID=254406 RepID=A0A1I4JBR7_9RHOB|nr:NAD(P)/FAD-dependent oxidoreductase [Shimia aestuarii]SFL63980.1 Thioredoxin reductase [Shimia aestuarii]
MKRVDLAVIGAGPAGMAAATEAAGAGLRVLLLDEQRSAGGQVFRNVDAASEVRDKVLGQDFVVGRKLTMGLAHRDITHVTGASVWSIEDRVVRFVTGDEAQEVCAEHVLLATGALERAMPVPGWTLPGVMTAGAAQIMLKEAGIATRDAVLVGSGPLLYLVAVQLLRAGYPPRALVETQTRGDMRGALIHWRAALRGWRYLQRGAAMLNELRNAGIARFVGAREVTLLGRRRVEAVHFRCGGTVHELASDTVLLHHGVVPNVQAARAVGVPHRWNNRQHAFVPEVDRWGRTPVEGIWIAGDGAGIGGAQVAEQSGRIAGWAIAQALGGITLEERNARALPLISKRAIELSIRSFLERAYPPYEAALVPEDEATVCRCEEVSAQEIRAAATSGCTGPDQLKAFTRAGMGRCQGRFCGLTVTRLMAEERGVDPDEVGYFRIRPPIKPVSLGALAALHDPNDPLEQVGGHD